MTTAPARATRDFENETQRARVLALLREHGWNSTSFQVLEQGFVYWFDTMVEGCVAYVDTGSAWVAAGGPIAHESELAACARRFSAAARRAGRRSCFFAVEERMIRAASLRSMPIGEQPSWAPRRWPEALASSRNLREQLRRARAKGVRVRQPTASEIADPTSVLRRRVQGLIDSWLRSRKMAPMGFLVNVEPFAFPEERQYLVAEHEGEIVGVLVAVPVFTRNGWLFEDLLRSPSAPNGTVELLVDAGMRRAAERGLDYVTLGLAPLAGALPRWLRVVRSLSVPLFDFDGLRRFKAKLAPDAWSPIYLSWPEGGSGNLALYDALAAFTTRSAAGDAAAASFARFGVETVLRSPALAVRVLGILLVPWTIMLAVADTATWFPSHAVQVAWVVFDVLLVVAMLSLARRWRPRLGYAAAIAITVDAVLTTVEAISFNASRSHGVAQRVVLVVACLGPVLAATLLWGVLLRRRAPTDLRV